MLLKVISFPHASLGELSENGLRPMHQLAFLACAESAGAQLHSHAIFLIVANLFARVAAWTDRPVYLCVNQLLFEVYLNYATRKRCFTNLVKTLRYFKLHSRLRATHSD